MQSVKDAATNLAASAKAGMEKTMATVEEKIDHMQTNDPVKKERATHKKIEKICHAELAKRETREKHALGAEPAKQSITGKGHTTANYAALTTGQTTAAHSASDFGVGTGFGGS